MTIRDGQTIEVDGAPAWSGWCEVDDGFSLAWEQPGDAQRTWTWNASHWPLPFSPLSVDYAEALYTGIERELRLRPYERGRRVYRHGFLYEWRPKPGPDAGPADPVIEKRKRT